MNDAGAPEPRAYPPPPWQMHGRATIQPLLVRSAAVELPPGFRAVATLGRTLGLVAYIEYEPPSPLCYHELLFMSAFVTAGGARGYFVAAIYVDDETTLVAGRQEWALPKLMARFDRRGDEVRVEADDGARIELTVGARGPLVPFRGGVATIQPRGSELVRFRSSFRGRARLGRLEVTTIAPSAAWRPLVGATRLPGAVSLEPFEATMHPPWLGR